MSIWFIYFYYYVIFLLFYFYFFYLYFIITGEWVEKEFDSWYGISLFLFVLATKDAWGFVLSKCAFGWNHRLTNFFHTCLNFRFNPFVGNFLVMCSLKMVFTSPTIVEKGGFIKNLLLPLNFARSALWIFLKIFLKRASNPFSFSCQRFALFIFISLQFLCYIHLILFHWFFSFFLMTMIQLCYFNFVQQILLISVNNEIL